MSAPTKALQTLISNPIFLETAKFDFGGHTRLLEKTFSSLVAKQQKYIQKDVLEYDKRLKVIELATNMMQEHLHSVCTYAGESDVSELEIPTEIANAKTAVQYVPVYIGYALANNSRYDLEEEFEKSMPSLIIQCGKNIAEKIVYINEVCAAKGICEILKPTTKSLTAISQLTTAFAVDSNTFETVTDSLYFLLYEGSGDAKRILDFLSDEECSPLWNIKHLRTDFRHDVDHGKSSDIKKKKIAIGKAYHEICGMLRPLKQKDWVNAHHNLFIKTDAFLELLILFGS